MSNSILKATCDENGVFNSAYEAAKKGMLPAKNCGTEVAKNVKISNKCTAEEIIFVLLREPVTFKGKTKAYY